MLKRLFGNRGKSSPPFDEMGRTWGEVLLDELLKLFEEEGDKSVESPLALLARIYATHAEIMPADVDDKIATQYGRSILALILDNDASPPRLQLRNEELESARSLLKAFFFAENDVQESAGELLRFIEERFADECFTQSRNLLELFDTEPATQRHNDLNLFYESFLVRVQAQRASEVSANTRTAWQSIAKESLEDEEHGLGRLIDWLREEASVRLHLPLRDPEELDRWTNSLSDGAGSAGAEALLQVIPPRRYRVRSGTLSQLAEHLVVDASNRSLFEHSVHLTKCAYFVARSVGRTGFEYIPGRFVRWVDRTYETSGMQLLPEIHSETLAEVHSLTEIINDAAHRHFSKRQDMAPSLSAPVFHDALKEVHQLLSGLSLESLPEGEYSLAGLVYDRILGFEFDKPEDALRLHRLL